MGNQPEGTSMRDVSLELRRLSVSPMVAAPQFSFNLNVPALMDTSLAKRGLVAIRSILLAAESNFKRE